MRQFRSGARRHDVFEYLVEILERNVHHIGSHAVFPACFDDLFVEDIPA